MPFKKLQVDLLFDGFQFLRQKVLVIAPNGIIADIIEPEQAGLDVEVVEGMLTPGFINCHCHLELSHLHNQIAQHTGLPGFVKQVVQKRNTNPSNIEAAILEAENAMTQNGIVAVGDISNTLHSLKQKQKNNLYYHNFIEAIGFNPQLADENFETYQKMYLEFIREFNPNQVSITPHAPYSVSNPLMQKIIRHNSNGLLSIHNQESPEENLWFAQKTGGFSTMFEEMGLNTKDFKPSGKTSLQTYFPHFLSHQQIILVHNVHSTEEDVVYVQQSNNSVFWCLCPNANQYINNTLPDLNMLTNQKANLVLGTDSLASNHQLSIWEEIQTLRTAFPHIPLNLMLQWATINGARALKIDHEFGSFEKGKRPGVVQILDNKINRLF